MLQPWLEFWFSGDGTSSSLVSFVIFQSSSFPKPEDHDDLPSIHVSRLSPSFSTTDSCFWVRIGLLMSSLCWVDCRFYLFVPNPSSPSTFSGMEPKDRGGLPSDPVGRQAPSFAWHPSPKSRRASGCITCLSSFRAVIFHRLLPRRITTFLASLCRHFLSMLHLPLHSLSSWLVEISCLEKKLQPPSFPFSSTLPPSKYWKNEFEFDCSLFGGVCRYHLKPLVVSAQLSEVHLLPLRGTFWFCLCCVTLDISFPRCISPVLDFSLSLLVKSHIMAWIFRIFNSAALYFARYS